MAAESLLEKAHRLLTENRLTVISLSDYGVRALCRGDSGVWRLGGAGGAWRCDCPATGFCSHLLALAHVVVRAAALEPPVPGQLKPGSVEAIILGKCTCSYDLNEGGRGYALPASFGPVAADERGEVLLERGWKIDPDCPLHGGRGRS